MLIKFLGDYMTCILAVFPKLQRNLLPVCSVWKIKPCNICYRKGSPACWAMMELFCSISFLLTCFFFFLCLFPLMLYTLVYVQFSYLQWNLYFTFLEFTFSFILCTFLSVMPKVAWEVHYIYITFVICTSSLIIRWNWAQVGLLLSF
jgi:hypothetical protein